jgi:hypothetical protein
MNYKEIRESNMRLEVLVGGNLVAVGRASSLAWFVFEKDGEEYALHLQTGFRVVVDDAVFLAGDDIYRPTDAMMGCEGFDYAQFDWGIQGGNRYDERVVALDERFGTGLVVTGASVTQFGDLAVQMAGHVRLEVFVTSSQDECWRFFKRHSDDHLVVMGYGIEPQDNE